MKILVNERLSKNKMKTSEGYLICTDAILARTGKQQYRKSEIWQDCDDANEIVDIDRPYEEVFSEATLASFENKPITVEHPDVDVDTSNYKDYAVGFVRDVHQGKVDGQDVILGTLVITDQQTIEEIENGEHTDLSCGYDCDIVDENNPRQTNIRGNHVALCQQGRAGIARIVDTATVNDAENDDKELYNELRREFYNWADLMYKDLMTKGKTTYEFHSDRSDEYQKKFGKYGIKVKLLEKIPYMYMGGPRRNDYAYSTYVVEFRKVKDSVNDANYKLKDIHWGYAILLESRYRKYGMNAVIERWEKTLDNARVVRDSLERNDGLAFVIIDCNNSSYKIVDSTNIKDAYIDLDFDGDEDDARKLANRYGCQYKWTGSANGYPVFRFTGPRDKLQKLCKTYGMDKQDFEYFVEDSIQDVEPRTGESKADFIKRFMSETANEYPDEKQRYAIALKYRKGKDSMINDSNKDKRGIKKVSYLENIRKCQDRCLLKDAPSVKAVAEEIWYHIINEDFSAKEIMDMIKKQDSFVWDKLARHGDTDYFDDDDEVDNFCRKNKSMIFRELNKIFEDEADRAFTDDELEEIGFYDSIEDAENDDNGLYKALKETIGGYVDGMYRELMTKGKTTCEEWSDKSDKYQKALGKYGVKVKLLGIRPPIDTGHHKGYHGGYTNYIIEFTKVKDSISDSNIVVKDSTGEQFNIVKVPGDGFVYLQSRFDGRLAKTYEETFKSKYSYKKV